MQTALDRKAEIIVTFDADGQHNPKDIPRLISPILKNEADVVIGSRIIGKKNNMPLFRKILNYLANLSTLIFFGIWVSDSQSGLRAFNKKAAEK